jgi:hypothetical protein
MELAPTSCQLLQAIMREGNCLAPSPLHKNTKNWLHTHKKMQKVKVKTPFMVSLDSSVFEL